MSRNPVSAPRKVPGFSLMLRLSRALWQLRHYAPALAIFILVGLETQPLRHASATPDSTQRAQALGDILPSFSTLVERVAPSVVSIRVKADPTAITMEDDEDQQSSEKNPFEGTPLDRFFEGPKGKPAPKPHEGQAGAVPLPPVHGQGSGFFISSDGYVVTNHHVVEGALEVEVVTQNDEVFEAKVIGSDPGTDLALIKVEGGKNFPAVKLCQREPKVGDWVIALGNPFGLEGTVTAGIVSARGRDIGLGAYDNFIQIDAPVNKGNSGGPTFNQAGEVIGVNTAIFSPTGGSVGIAFAIPAKSVANIVAQLKEKGRVTRGWLGVQVQAVTPPLADSLGLKEARGALVSAPLPGSPAEAAGVRRGDVILKIGEGKVKNGRDLARQIAALPPGSEVIIVILRDGVSKDLNVRLAELKEETKAESTAPKPRNQTEIGALGMSVAPKPEGKGEATAGLTVLDIRPDGRAADAGLVQGDVILTVNGAEVPSVRALETALASAKATGKKHALALVQRGATEIFIALPTETG